MFEMSKKEIDKLMMTGFRKIPFTIRRRWSTMWIDRSIWTSEILRPTRTQWTIRLSLAHIRRWWDEDDALQTEGGDPTAVVALTSGRRRRRLRIGGREIRRAEVRNGRRRGSLFLFFFFFFSIFYFYFFIIPLHSHLRGSSKSGKISSSRRLQVTFPPPQKKKVTSRSCSTQSAHAQIRRSGRQPEEEGEDAVILSVLPRLMNEMLCCLSPERDIKRSLRLSSFRTEWDTLRDIQFRSFDPLTIGRSDNQSTEEQGPHRMCSPGVSMRSSTIDSIVESFWNRVPQVVSTDDDWFQSQWKSII